MRGPASLEGTPGEQHLVARAAGRLSELVAQRDGTCRNRNVIARHTRVRRDCVNQFRRPRVGVAIDVMRCLLDDFDYLRQRWIRVLVGRNLERLNPVCPGIGALTCPIAGDIIPIM